jgi:hypothetical protein
MSETTTKEKATPTAAERAAADEAAATSTRRAADTKAVAKSVTDDKSSIEQKIEKADAEEQPLLRAETEVKELTKAALALHDVRDDLTKRMGKMPQDDTALQAVQSAVYGIEDGIRGLDQAIRKAAMRKSELVEAKAVGMGTSKGTSAETRGGPPISRGITEAAAQAVGDSHIPGTAGSIYPDPLTPAEVKGKGLEGALAEG